MRWYLRLGLASLAAAGAAAAYLYFVKACSWMKHIQASLDNASRSIHTAKGDVEYTIFW